MTMQPEIKSALNLDIMDPKLIPHVLNEGDFGVSIECTVWDPKKPRGQQITSHVIKKSESYVQQFLQLLFCQMIVVPFTFPISITDTTPAARNVRTLTNTVAGGYIFDVFAGAGVITFGIVVGTGIAAPLISDAALGTIILHDAAPPTANRLQYSAVSYGAPVADATTSQLTITRNFANGSGGAITVQEAGLYCRAFDGAVRYFCIIRDVTGGIVVPIGQTLTINYRPQGVA